MPQDRPHEDVTTWLQPSIICGILEALIPADDGLRVGNNACSRESGLGGRHFGDGRPWRWCGDSAYGLVDA